MAKQIGKIRVVGNRRRDKPKEKVIEVIKEDMRGQSYTQEEI